MMTFLVYDVKVAVLIAVFYMFYRLLLAHESFHRLTRVVLLGTAVLSFVLPLCVITFHDTITVGMSEGCSTRLEVLPMRPLESPVSVVDGPMERGDSPVLPVVLTVLYVAGVLTVVARMVLSVWRIHRIIKDSEWHDLAGGVKVAVNGSVAKPFSWWKTVVMSPVDYEGDHAAILTHELGHIRHRHSVDVVLVELLTALQWFNPAMWMLRSDLRTIHEYEADQTVISHGFDVIQYLQLLIRKTADYGGYSIANGISNSTLKKRVDMIMKKKSSRWQWLRLAYILPVVGLSLYATAETQIHVDVDPAATGAPVPAVLLLQKTGDDGVTEEYYRTTVPVGAVYTWMVNGRVVERGLVEEGSFWQHHRGRTDDFVVTIDGREIAKDDLPLIPVESIKEVTYTQGEVPRHIDLRTSTQSRRYGTTVEAWRAWLVFVVEDCATGSPLKGAVVSITETGEKATVNGDGWCELEVPAGATVTVTYDGMETQTVRMDPLPSVGRWFRMTRPGSPIYSSEEVQQPATFPGDMEKWFAAHRRLPASVAPSGYVTFWCVVNEDGSVSGVRIKQGVSAELNAETVRLVRSMPKWKPAVHQGKAVKSLCVGHVDFSFQSVAVR